MRPLSLLAAECHDLDVEIAHNPDRALDRANISRVLRSVRHHKTAVLSRQALGIEQDKIRVMHEMIVHPEMKELVHDGHVTYGMIKPRANEAKFVDKTDTEVAAEVMAEITDPLEIMMSQAFHIPQVAANRFYRHLPPHILPRVTEHMTGGAVTGLVLCNPKGDAIKEWRAKIGATKPENAEPGTIRNKYALSVENNVVHGSDSIQSVQVELRDFDQRIGQYLLH